jgi:trk system potassium uptake protein TrkH
MDMKKMNIQRMLTRVSPIQVLVFGYIIIILGGSLILRLPLASSEGNSQQYIDALFTATSAVSTTGLIVVDTGTFYSLFGQTTILLLFQIGGLGYMAFVVLMIYVLGRRLSLVSAVTLQESLSGITLGNMKKYLKAVFLFTFLFEGMGALFLTLYWSQHFSLSKSIYLGVFHSVSAFCTSGFSVFSDSLTAYQTNWVITGVICTLSMAGGVGFIVLTDIRRHITKRIHNVRPYQVLIHTKMALLLSTFFITTGAVVIFLSEKELLLPLRLYASVFQSISASSTTGFNTLDIGGLSQTSLFMIIVLMFVGASPGGSGGGIKVTAFGTMALSVWALLRGRKDVNLFGRRIPSDTVRKSFSVGLIAAVWVIMVTMILTVTENQAFLTILFEVVSAIGTVGLSTGITPVLSSAGKFFIIITMVIGRVGPLAIAFSLIGDTKPVDYRYAEEEVFIG